MDDTLMRRLIGTIAAFLIVCGAASAQSILAPIMSPAPTGGGGATITFVQGGTMSHTSSSTTVTATTLNGNVTAGDVLLVYADCDVAGTLSISDAITGGGSQTWTAIQSNVSATPAAGQWSVWAAYNATGVPGANTDTITITSTSTCTNFNAAVAEFSISPTGSFDQGPASASGLTSGSVTPTAANELVIGLVAGGDGGTTPTAGTGYTLLGATNLGGANPGWEYKIISAIASQSATFATGSGTVQTSILTFK